MRGPVRHAALRTIPLIAVAGLVIASFARKPATEGRPVLTSPAPWSVGTYR